MRISYLGEDLVALQSALDGFEGDLGDANTFVVGLLDQGDDRLKPVPGHRSSPLHHGVDAVE